MIAPPITSMDEYNPIQGIGETFDLLMDAQHGNLTDGQKVLNLRGDSPAEALGNAYVIRDAIRDEGYQAHCEHRGLADEQPDWSSKPRHEILLIWSD